MPFIGFELLWGTGFSMGFNGPILMGFVVAVGGSLTAAGRVSAMAQVVGMAMQPLSVMLFGRSGKRRYVAVGLQWANAAMIALPVAAVYGMEPERFAAWALYVVGGMVLLQAVAGSMNGPVYYSLMVDAVSEERRGLLQGVRQVCLVVSGLGAAGLAREVLAGAEVLFNYAQVFALAMGFVLGPVGIVSPLVWGYLLDGGMGLSGQVVWAVVGGLGLLGLAMCGCWCRGADYKAVGSPTPGWSR